MSLRNELLIDLENCELRFNKRNIRSYINKICKVIKMKKHGKLILWEDAHNKIRELRGGISACQFIKTSSIVVHSFEKFNSCYIDIFSCRNFDMSKAARFSKDFFKAEKMRVRKISNF